MTATYSLDMLRTLSVEIVKSEISTAASRRDADICAGYGLTETNMIAMTRIGQFKLGSTGQVTPNTSAKVSSTIRYDTRCYFNVRSKADMSQLNLPHGNNN